MIDIVDSHAHLQEPEFDADREAVIERALTAGVRQTIVSGVDLATSAAAVRLAERYEGLYAAAGFHPHEAEHLTGAALQRIESLLAHPKVVAVGEIGLDFYRMHSPRETQVAALQAMLDLAARHALPVVVHCRDAWEELTALLEPWARRVAPAFAGRPLGVMHYFSSHTDVAQRYIGLGFMISIHTSVTHPKASQLREVAAALPLESLLVETDSPYGAPQSHRGKRNQPAYVLEAVSKIAELRDLPPETVAASTSANARRLFGLPVPAEVAVGATA